ncbi:hypothetical protein LL033_25100 (plasmid) [Clostridium estertheticum]|uniref:hypothetical protein n=1 Tax=Clostridium estertheticum TaxID=238834 RepID=UPI001C0C180A|nr:hypothetical protein [Clostridium estertheticum]MBU3217250.1 hypothetical protein [Clostridium estertheticum]WAG58402.1 hypothetical protein LL033_25100 [Clostridium estertheticum]
MKKKKLQIFGWVFIMFCMMIGGFWGIYIGGNDPIEYVMPIIGGLALGSVVTLILYKWNKKRNGNVPDVDERTLLLLRRYLMIVLYGVLFGSGAILLVLYSMGVHSIETGMLIVYMMVLYILIGVGAIITKCL